MSYRLFAQIGSTGSLPAFTVLVAILAYRGLTGLVPWRLRMDRTGRVPPGCANRTLGAVGSTPRGRPLPRDAHSPRRPDHARPLRARPRVRGGRHAPATRPIAPDDSAQVDRQPSCGRGVPGSSMRILTASGCHSPALLRLRVGSGRHSTRRSPAACDDPIPSGPQTSDPPGPAPRLSCFKTSIASEISNHLSTKRVSQPSTQRKLLMRHRVLAAAAVFSLVTGGAYAQAPAAAPVAPSTPGASGVVAPQNSTTGSNGAVTASPTGQPADTMSNSSSSAGNANQPERAVPQGGGGGGSSK